MYVFKARYYKTFYLLTKATALSSFFLFERDYSGVFLGAVHTNLHDPNLAHEIQTFKPSVVRVRRFKNR